MKCKLYLYISITGYPRLMSYSSRFIVLGESFFLSESSYSLKIQPNDSKPKRQPNNRRAVLWLRFLLFNSAFDRPSN